MLGTHLLMKAASASHVGTAEMTRNEDRLQFALRAARVGAWEWDLSTGQMTWSDNLEPLLGLASGIFGRAPASLDAVHPDDRPGVVEAVSRAVREGTYCDMEFRTLQPDGSVRWFAAKGQPSRDDTGKVIRIIGIAQDVTEHVRARELVRDSERRFRSLIENTLDLVAIVAADGTYRYASPSHAQASGFSPEELVGRSGFDFVHPDDLPTLQRLWAEAMRNRQMTGSAEYRFRHKNGSWRIVEGVVRNLLDDPIVGGVLINARDITERKHMEEALRASESRFRALLESAPDAVVIVDREAHIVGFVNAQAEKLFGYPREELFGQPIEILVPDRLRERHVKLRSQFTVHPEPRPMRFRQGLVGRRKDGSEFPVDIMLGPVDMGGELLVLAIVHDVTEQQRAEAEIRRLNTELERRVIDRTAQLEAANKELEAFSYSVSHDLRAPLRAIEGFSEALLEDYTSALDAQGQQYLQRVRQSTERMGQLIDDLLSLSRVARSEVQWQPVALSALAETIAAELQKAQPERRVEFVIQAGVVAHGDARLLRVALENLLGNAWKYTSKHATARIEFGLRIADCGLQEHQFASPGSSNPQSDIRSPQSVFFVRDDGAGFDAAYADKLFGAFQRLHTAGEFEGTGVGLATVQRIIHRHGGRIWAEGAVERGATFYFTLPPPSR